MPITDVQTTFLTGALNTGGAATYQGQFTYDMWGGQASLPTDAIGNTINIDQGLGKEVKIIFECTAAVTSGGSATVQFQVVDSDDAAESTNVTVLNQGQVWGKASLTAGFIERLTVPPNTLRRYLGIQYIVGTAALTAGSFSVYLVIDEPSSLPIT